MRTAGSWALYWLVSLMSAVGVLLVPGGLVIALLVSVPLGIAASVAGAATYMPLAMARRHFREICEYDEFGRSKKKSNYLSLSKKERDMIDLQKQADMERVLSTTEMRRITRKGSVSPEKDMNALIGLDEVKQRMREMNARMEYDRKLHRKNDGETRHMVFFGSPGTGKTTVARIMAGFLYRNGYIRKNKVVEVDGNFLKCGDSTALKTTAVIRASFDGVLFIDEAYALMSDGYGRTAIATLIKMMEDERGRFVLILAGYTNEMKQLLASNPGFSSRIRDYLMFPDYSDAELREILISMAGHQGLMVSAGAYGAFDTRMRNERRTGSFGNGRTVRNVLEEAIDRHAYNLSTGAIDQSCSTALQEEDFSTEVRHEGF